MPLGPGVKKDGCFRRLYYIVHGKHFKVYYMSINNLPHNLSAVELRRCFNLCSLLQENVCSTAEMKCQIGSIHNFNFYLSFKLVIL